MAYSRWNNSKWFVFGSSDQTVPKLEQYLSMIYLNGTTLGFTYQELKCDLQNCLKKVVNEVPSTPNEIEELKIYIGEFLIEVDEEGKQGETPDE